LIGTVDNMFACSIRPMSGSTYYRARAIAALEVTEH
jgi:hypothetical protein